MTLNITIIIIVFATTSIGALVRIFHEMEKEPINFRKKILIYMCAIAVGYICYETAINYEMVEWVGVMGIIGGITSIDIVNLIIDKVPNLIFKKISNKFNSDDGN